MTITRQGPDERGQGYGAILDANIIAASRKFTELQQKAAYLDLAPVPVMVMDREHTILFLNPAAARLSGRSLEGSLGLKSWDLIDSPTCRAGTCSGVRAMRERQTVAIEATATAQGKTIRVRVISTPVYNANQEVVGFLEVLEDIAGQVQESKKPPHAVTASREGRPGDRGKILPFRKLRREGTLKLFRNLIKGGTMRLRQAVAILILLADAIELNYTLRKMARTVPADDANPNGQKGPRRVLPS